MVRIAASSLLVLSLFFAIVSCGDDGDPSVRLRVPAGSASELTVEGPLGTSLVVPAGASSTDVTIVLSAPRTRRTAPAGVTSVGPMIRLEPEGATFAKVIELTIPIRPSALPAGKTIDDVIVLRVDMGSDAFVPLPTRRSGDAVVASTEHFCDFLPVVLVDEAALPFGACLDRVCDPSETCSACPADCGACLPSADTVPPNVVSATASGPSDGLPADAVFTLVFDEALMPASVSARSITLESDQGSVALSMALDGTTLVLTPMTPLPHATAFELAVVGVRDLAGNVSTTKFSTAFATATQSPVTLLASSPASGDVGVHPRQDLVLTFSGPVDPASFVLQPTDTVGSACAEGVGVGDGTTCYGGVVAALSPTTIAIRPTTSLGLGAATTLSVALGATDSNGYPLAAIPQVQFVVSPVNDFAYRIERGPTFAGDRGGVAGADASCDPSGAGRRKAFLLASTRYPCTTQNCSGAETGPVDWVLRTSTTYVNAEGALLFTTDEVHPIFTAWPMANVFRPGGVNFAWGGATNVSDWVLSATATCVDWTNQTSAHTYSVGFEDSQVAGFIAGGSVNCIVELPHLCVDQVPATLPALH